MTSVDCDDGGRGLQDAQGVAITMQAEPEIRGRYTGSFQGQEQGVPVTINYFENIPRLYTPLWG